MKITVIHNVYKQNPLINETIRLNLLALRNAEVDFQYIVFNDKGDKIIAEDIKEILQDIYYFYSNTNYGNKKCTGGWLGAEKENIIEGDIIHNIGQDDVMTSLLYREAKKCFESNRSGFFTSNGFKVDEELKLIDIMIHPEYQIEYNEPLKQFKEWFGIQNNTVTRANNGMLASGTMYRRELHDSIGLPDLDDYGGATDFFYWANMLYNEYRGKYLSMPSWYYRQSKYSAGNEIIDGKINRGTDENPGHQQIAIQNIKEYFSKLVKDDKRFK